MGGRNAQNITGRTALCILQEDPLSIFVSVSLNLHKNQMVFYYS